MGPLGDWLRRMRATSASVDRDVETFGGSAADAGTARIEGTTTIQTEDGVYLVVTARHHFFLDCGHLLTDAGRIATADCCGALCCDPSCLHSCFGCATRLDRKHLYVLDGKPACELCLLRHGGDFNVVAGR